MSRYDRLAIIFSIMAVAATTWIGSHFFENLPHIEDEIAYVWEAEAIAYGGSIKLASPPCPPCFLVPFVIDYQNERFGKYPIAWPVVLAAGIRLGLRNLVNPLLAGLGIWLTYRLGKKVMNARVGLLAAFLTIVSPFFLMNSSSLLSHPLALDLSLVFALAWMDTFWQTKDKDHVSGSNSDRQQNQSLFYKLMKKQAPGWLTATTGGMALGTLALTRPLTAIGVSLPFAVHGVIMLWKGPRHSRRLLYLTAGIAFAVSLLFFAWQFSLTGNPFLDPYTLWWPYDRIGFGPGIGVAPGGNDLPHALTNIHTSLNAGASDLFGWGMFSWIFLPFGIWAVRTNRLGWLAGSVFPSLIVTYMFYWIGSWLLGPRYYYEGLYSLTILSAAGILWLFGSPAVSGKLLHIFNHQPETGFFQIRKPDFGIIRKPVRQIAVGTLVVFLVTTSLVYYDPIRFDGLHGLYGVSRSSVNSFLYSVRDVTTPALVIVHTQSSWIGYGTLLDLETPLLNTPYIFIIDNGPDYNQVAINAFPDRTVIDYYPPNP